MTAKNLSRRSGSQATAASPFSLPPYRSAVHARASRNILDTRHKPRWTLTIFAFAVLGALAQPAWAEGGGGGSGTTGAGGAGAADVASGPGMGGGTGTGGGGGGGSGGPEAQVE